MNINSKLIYCGSHIDIKHPTIDKRSFRKYFSYGFYGTMIKEEAERIARLHN